MKTVFSMCLLAVISLQAEMNTHYSTTEKEIFSLAKAQGTAASKIQNTHLNQKENCNVAYGKLKLTSTQQSNIDVFIKGFFNGCTHPLS